MREKNNFSNNSLDTNTIIAQTEYKISNVTHSVESLALCFTKSALTWLPDGISNRNKESISLKELENRINLYKSPKKIDEKINNSGFLKGIYSGYYNGANCTKSVPYLCYDIDVKSSNKSDENPHLMNPINNKKVFDELQKISVLCWKSNSGNGIAGLFYVPQIEQYTNDTKEKHLKVGKHITAYVSNYLYKTTGVDRVIFDSAQSKFRQVRLIADQRNIERVLNPHPFVFTYQSAVVEKITHTGVTKYRFSDYRQPENSIFSQFNNDNNILDLLANKGFTIMHCNGNKVRVKHSASESSSSGFVNKSANTYVNFSSSFDSSGKDTFTPSRLVCKLEFNNDWKKFAEYLYHNGYKNKEIAIQEVKSISKSLKDELKGVADEAKASKIIFKHCFELKCASNEVKRQFIADNCTRPDFKKYFITNLNFVDYKINYDKQLFIKQYVSEVLPQVLDYADRHNRVVLRADTGKGKTTAFIRNFHKYRPEERILILVPLTIIVDQYRKEYSDIAVFLTGKSDGFEHEKSYSAKIVFSTYEQGTKHLEGQCFDYIIIDEVHQLLTANSFKSDVIADLTALIKNSNTIGLTGTPSQIFTQLNFKLLNVDVEHPRLMKGEARVSNRSVSSIVMTHLMHRPEGKVLIRVNAIDTSKAIIEELVEKKIYKKSETLILYSSKEIKESNNYKNLAYQREFFDKYKIVFTTAMIDEGISIDQMGFTDVLFIETSYHPRPEPIKQFFARFRNEEVGRRNYLYLRQKKLQIPSQFKPELMFAQDLETLINDNDQEEAKDVLTTYNNLFSNNSYYYSDATVNSFYLGYAVTQVLFRQFNMEQFLDYLESNYYLSFTVNKEYEVDNLKLKDNEHKMRLKQQVAKYWIEEKSQIEQVLMYQSQNSYIKNTITKQQVRINKDIKEFAKEHLKHFEALFLKEKKLRHLGVENPLEVLIKTNGEEATLQSNDYYRKRIAVLKVIKAIHNPITKADKRTAEQFVHFAQWCELKKSFSNKQMYDELKQCGVLNHKAFRSENMLFEIVKYFDLIVKRNKKTNIITCKKK